MTGGMAFVYDAGGHCEEHINKESVVYQRLASAHWEKVLKDVIGEHWRETASPRAETILSGWEFEAPKFWQICPKEMLERLEMPLSDTTGQAVRA